MIKVTERNLKVDYYEKEGDKNIWFANSHLSDEEHDISLLVEIDMLEMKIISSRIKFRKAPLNNCELIENNASKLNGLIINPEFVRNAMKIFMGPLGCPNIMTLLQISIPGIIYYYYPHKFKTGEFAYEQWDKMIRTELKDACLAHSMLQEPEI